MNTKNIHEISFIKTFVIREKQERCLALINKKNRKKFRLLLAHNIGINEKKAHIPKKEEDNEDGIYLLLKKFGAPNTCHVICENSKYDDLEMDLKDALHELFTLDLGYIISCIPGKLAFYQGEAPFNRVILFC